MSHAIAVCVSNETAARRLAEWLGKIVHSVRVAPRQGSWCILVPNAAVSRARNALKQVIVAANPRRRGRVVARAVRAVPRVRLNGARGVPKGQIEWLVDRMHVGKMDSEVEAEIRKRTTGAGWTPARIREAVAHAVAHHRRNRGLFTKVVSGINPNPINKRARRAAKRLEQRVKEHLGLSGRPLPRRTWTGGRDAFGDGQRAGSGYVRFWLWNDREWKLNLRSSYDGVGGEPSLRESAQGYANDEAEKKGIAKKWPGQVGKWKAGFVLAFEKAIAGAFGPRREFDDYGESKEMDQSNRLRRRRAEHRKKFAGKNPGRFLIQGLRPKHRNWVTIAVVDDEERALLNALRRARLGDVFYRVWDTGLVKEVWRGKGKDAKIEHWQTRRPAGLVGANRRMTMLRNPRLSKRMMPLHENTMRLGDAMKWGRRLLDAGIGVHVWDGSGWEAAIKPDDSYSTPSGRAATGGRRYLGQGAGLIKTWPITLIAPQVAPGMWLTGAAIGHFLSHRAQGVASNPGACRNPLCLRNRRRSVRRNDSLSDLDHQFSMLQRELDAMKKAGTDNKPEYLVKLQALAALSKKRLAASGIVIRRAGENPRRGRQSSSVKRPKRATIWCRMCGEWLSERGPYRVPKVGPQKGNILCDLCYRGWRSGRRGGSKWAMNPRKARMSALMNSPVEANARKAHEEIVGAFMAGRSKRIGARYTTDGRELRVWGNLIAHKVNGSIRLRDAGYRTLLTKNVLNTVLQHMGAGSIYQKAHEWYLSTPMGPVAWTGEWTVGHRAAAANPRIRAWDIVAYIPGKPERWGMQSGHKDKKKAEEIAQVYRRIAKKEGRRTRYVVEPFRYSDTASRSRAHRNPPISQTWDRLTGRQRLSLLGFAGFPDEYASAMAGKPWDRLSASAARALQRGWQSNPWYYGYKKGGGTEAFHSRTKPTERSHGHRYGAVTGPRSSAAQAVRDMQYVSPYGPHSIMRRGKATRANPPELRPHFPYRVLGTAELDTKKLSGKTVVYLGMAKGPAGSGSWARVRIMKDDGRTGQAYLIRAHCLTDKLHRNPLTRGESATLLRQAKLHVTTARHDRAAKKHGIASYAAGRAQGKASAVLQYGPRSARRAARKLLERQANTNPHAGLRGLMSNGDAKKAMKFA